MLLLLMALWRQEEAAIPEARKALSRLLSCHGLVLYSYPAELWVKHWCDFISHPACDSVLQKARCTLSCSHIVGRYPPQELQEESTWGRLRLWRAGVVPWPVATPSQIINWADKLRSMQGTTILQEFPEILRGEDSDQWLHFFLWSTIRSWV